MATAKLLLDDVSLQDFPYAVKVSYALQKNPAYFVCNSNEMEFDDVVSAVRDDEELQPGQLYFLFLINRLSHRIQPLKASSALSKGHCSDNRCGCRRNNIPEDGGLPQPRKAAGSGRRRGKVAMRYVECHT